jgi:hypothetical protein
MDEAIFAVMFAALFLVPIVLIGLLLFRVVSGGVTVRKVMYGLLGIALVGLADFGGLMCLMAWAYRHEPGPVGPWWEPLTLLIAPLLGYRLVLGRLLREREELRAELERRFAANEK